MHVILYQVSVLIRHGAFLSFFINRFFVYEQDNKGLKLLDLSWNGFHKKGCQHLGDALLVNSDLQELNLNCNRINKDCLEKLLKGFKQNSSLRTIKVSDRGRGQC